MPDAHVAAQPQHVALVKYIAHQAVTLASAKRAVSVGGDSGRILPAVLQHGQRIINCLVNRLLADDSDYSTHG